MMVMGIGPGVGPPSFGGSSTIIDLPIPDHIRDPCVIDDLTGQHLAVHTGGGIMSQIERIPIIVVALARLMGRIAHNAVRCAVS